jgi:hypothetical protein
MRAAKRIADAERELEHYADLNQRIDAWNVEQLRSPTGVFGGDLPWAVECAEGAGRGGVAA